MGAGSNVDRSPRRRVWAELHELLRELPDDLSAPPEPWRRAVGEVLDTIVRLGWPDETTSPDGVGALLLTRTAAGVEVDGELHLLPDGTRRLRVTRDDEGDWAVRVAEADESTGPARRLDPRREMTWALTLTERESTGLRNPHARDLLIHLVAILAEPDRQHREWVVGRPGWERWADEFFDDVNDRYGAVERHDGVVDPHDAIGDTLRDAVDAQALIPLFSLLDEVDRDIPTRSLASRRAAELTMQHPRWGEVIEAARVALNVLRRDDPQPGPLGY